MGDCLQEQMELPPPSQDVTIWESVQMTRLWGFSCLLRARTAPWGFPSCQVRTGSFRLWGA